MISMEVRVVACTLWQNDAICNVQLQTDSGQSAMSRCLTEILQAIDSGDSQTARAGVLRVLETLKIASGYSSRARGGVQYQATYMLDSVLFADLLRPLSTETDILRDALQRFGLEIETAYPSQALK